MGIAMKPCKHLDYTKGKFIDCELMDISSQFPEISGGVRYWARGERWLAGPGPDRNPKNVQFCGAGRGRVNGILQCYTARGMSCYEAEEEKDGMPGGGAG